MLQIKEHSKTPGKISNEKEVNNLLHNAFKSITIKKKLNLEKKQRNTVRTSANTQKI